MPFNTSSGFGRWLTGHRLLKSIQPSTWPVAGGDSGDAVGMPHIGVDLAAHIFELIQVGHGGAVILDRDAANLMKTCGVKEAQSGTAVAEDQILAIFCQAPAFAVVVEGAQQAKAEAVIDECDVRLPCELDERAAQPVRPSAKYCDGTGANCCTLPDSRSTMRSDEGPFRPVLSYKCPSR